MGNLSDLLESTRKYDGNFPEARAQAVNDARLRRYSRAEVSINGERKMIYVLGTYGQSDPKKTEIVYMQTMPEATAPENVISSKITSLPVPFFSNFCSLSPEL